METLSNLLIVTVLIACLALIAYVFSWTRKVHKKMAKMLDELEPK